MEKYNYKEVRKISLENIRQMCIEHNWYDYGTNKDYDTLLSYSNKDNITSDDIIEMAINIFDHTERFVKDIFDEAIFKTVCSIIVSRCFSYFKKID